MLFPLAFLSEIFKRIGPDFGQGGVIPVGLEKVPNVSLEENRKGQGLNQFPRVLAHALSSQNAPARLFRDHLHLGLSLLPLGNRRREI